MRSLWLAVAVSVSTLALPSSALAQERNHNAWGGRAFVSFNVGAQTASPNFGYDFTTTLFEQGAKAALDTPGKPGVTFDIGAGLRLIQNLGVGVTYSRYSNQRDATLTATIPDPLNMYGIGGDPSTVTEQVPLQREENAVHIQAIYRIPLGSRLQIGAFGGPSYFRCVDDHITKFALEGNFSQSMQWTVAFNDIAQAIDRGSAWGYHGGVSVSYVAAKHVGVGTTVRYSHASHTTVNHFSDTTNLEDYGIWGGNNGTVSATMTHGGVQWTGGISVHF